MAEYEESTSAVVDTITEAVVSGGLSATTAAAIYALLPENQEAPVVMQEYTPGQTVAANTVILNVPTGTNLTEDPGAGEAIIMGEGTKAEVTFAADSPIKAMVIGNAGGSNVTFEGDKPVTVQLTGGENDSVSTGSGSDEIVFNGGSATVDAGTGDDVVRIVPNMVGEVTVDAGDGFDQVVLTDGRANHSFVVNADGTITMHSDVAATMKGVSVVGFDLNGDHQLTQGDQVSVLAENANDALVASLYKVALGREPIDGADGWNDSTLGGINWWTTQYELYHPDVSLEQLAKDFLGEPEFNALYKDMTNAEFAQAIFNNLNEGSANPTNVVNGQTAAQFAEQLDAGMITREDVAFQVASSAEADTILGIDGIRYIIDYPGA